MAISLIKVAAVTLQLLIFFLNLPNLITFTFSNTPETPTLHIQFNYTRSCCIIKCPLKTCPPSESKTSIGLLCELLHVVAINNFTEMYCKSIQQCMAGFDIARRLCADLTDKRDDSDDLLRAVFNIVFDYIMSFRNSNEEQHPT